MSQLPIVKTGGIILDAGCSWGACTEELASYYRKSKIIGLDILDFSSDFVKIKKRNPNVDFIRGDLYKLREHFPENYFSAVFMMNNLYYVAAGMPQTNLKQILLEVAYVMQEGAKLCITNETPPNIFIKKVNNKPEIESVDKGKNSGLDALTLALKSN